MRTLLLTCLLSAPALAAPSAKMAPLARVSHEVDFEIRSTASSDESFDAFNDQDGFGTWGFRGAYALHPNLKLSAAWAHGGRGVAVHAGNQSFRTSLKVETLGLGLKGGWLYRDIVGPVATVQGLVLAGSARFDEDPHTPDNTGQHRRFGAAFGLSATAGVEVQVPTRSRIRPAASLEFGYLRTTNMALGDVGDVHFDGFTARGTMGVRF